MPAVAQRCVGQEPASVVVHSRDESGGIAGAGPTPFHGGRCLNIVFSSCHSRSASKNGGAAE